VSVVLRATGVQRRIGARAVVDGVDLGLARGTSTSLVGPSGCGKTTLLSILGLLDRPDAGEVHVSGHDAWTISEPDRARVRREKIGFVFQQANLFDGMTALDNVALPAWKKSGSRKDATRRAAALLERFGLASVAGSRAGALSGGEALRVAIARAIVNEPDVVLADEPTGSLDSQSARVVVDALFAVCERGAALLVVTHDPDVAGRADVALGMLDGRIVRTSRLPPSSIR
jgi:ABC-type lipoprotein export system ATPase subunit